MEKEEVDDDDDDEDGDWEDEGGWLPSGGNNTRQENPKNDIAQRCSIFSEKVQSPIWPGVWFALPKWADFAETFHLGEAHLPDPG